MDPKICIHQRNKRPPQRPPYRILNFRSTSRCFNRYSKCAHVKNTSSITKGIIFGKIHPSIQTKNESVPSINHLLIATTIVRSGSNAFATCEMLARRIKKKERKAGTISGKLKWKTRRMNAHRFVKVLRQSRGRINLRYWYTAVVQNSLENASSLTAREIYLSR